MSPRSSLSPQQVIAELDSKKVEGNPKIARKAESLIRRFREFERRGDTLSGVKLSDNRQFRESTLTPDVSAMPESFDSA